MTTRETLIAGLLSELADVEGMPMTERSLSSGYAREEGNVIIVHRGGEDPDYSQICVVDRTCEILVTVLGRGSVPEVEVDGVLALVHPVVMAYSASNLMQVDEVRTGAPRYADEDLSSCAVTVTYTFKYRTQPNTL